ncbi:MAG TPA: trypsin-like peptidase domain-containing protein [Mycobacteriales bacterium]|nr:trypsin-like peptidase domain-containing protein [Mycobacteriales bacterium]
MSDDLFWPPLSGGDDDGDANLGDRESPTAAYPTAPLGAGEPTYGGSVPAAPTGSDGSGGTGGLRRFGVGAMVAVTAFVFGAGGVAVGAELINHNGNSSPGSSLSSNPTQISPSALTTGPRSYARIASAVLPSVVSINVTSSNEDDTGSGVILQSNGYILTNNHVVAAATGGSGSVSVTFNDNSTASARIIGTDPLDDLAVIKVNRTGLKPATLGNSADIQVGDPVLAVGSPLGLTGTVTAGIVSALNRPVQTQEETQQLPPNLFGGGGSGSGSGSQSPTPTVIDAIQTDAAINPGNSGGALVDAAGDVIGINSAIASLSQASIDGSQSGNIGVGFAIPINQARTIANELMTTGHAVHPLLGVTLEDQTSASGADKALVHSVVSGGPAAKAGIKAGDVITGIDGVSTEGADAVIAAIRSHLPGQRVTVTIERGGSTKTVTATLTKQSSTQG